MPTPLPDKLRIKPGFSLFTLHAPADFKKTLGKLPEGVKVLDKGSAADQVHWFVTNRAQLEKELNKVMKLVGPGVTVWVYYPKGSSGIQTDLTRDKGWDCLLAEGDKLTWINLISFNETWSVFGFRGKTEADKKKAAKPKEVRDIFNWVNPATKEVKLPDDVAAALKKNKALQVYFDQLAFSHKKEYIEWIVTAKKEETRMKRVEGMMEKLREKVRS
jgi:Bacteriocin-protection, YdeI or OmpD-Associated